MKNTNIGKQKFAKLFALLLAVLFLCSVLIACSFDGVIGGEKRSTPDGTGDKSADEAGSGLPSKVAADGEIASDGKFIGGDILPTGDGENFDNKHAAVAAGQLTASALFDNDNYAFFSSLLENGQEPGAFYEYQQQFQLALNRVKVVLEGGALAKVTLTHENDVEWISYADKNGVCYLFNKEVRERYDISVEYTAEDGPHCEEFTVADGDTVTLAEHSLCNETLQIMFVIDTTGSMGDEIRYLQAEIKDVIETIAADNDVSVSLALMFYRDEGDDYVTRYFDFTTDIDAQVQNLSEQNAAGGGDFEEAVDVALTEAAQKQWSQGAGTKILVHVADAPAHDECVEKQFEAVKSLAKQGVRILNVAASGINKKTEYFFRSQCAQTNGCYAFLTDDSGIGGSHLPATVEEQLTVEYLNALLVRVINGMFSGTFEDPVPYQQTTTDQQ